MKQLLVAVTVALLHFSTKFPPCVNTNSVQGNLEDSYWIWLIKNAFVHRMKIVAIEQYFIFCNETC